MATLNNFKSYIFTGIKTTCTGCGACSLACTHNALEMQADNEGFVYPVLNTNNCIGCGLCDRTCPVVNPVSANKSGYQKCYISTTSLKEYYKESASIGICTMLSDYIVKQGGIVYGSYLDETIWKAYQLGVSDIDGVRKIRNSKYLQSNTKESFREARDFLKQGCLVLYIGTPCQIGGLKAFLRKEYDNLYTIDIICHGTFSPELMKLEVDYWQKKYESQITNFRFRSKRIYKRINGGMINFDILTKGGNKHIERHASASPSYRCYAYSPDGNSYNLRLSCYSCPFRAKERYADITVGDPWGVLNKDIVNKHLHSNNIIRSIYSENTEKGSMLISHIQSKLESQEYSWDVLFCQSAVQPARRIIPERREEFFKRVKLEDYGLVVEDITGKSLNKAHQKFVLNYYLEYFKSLIRPLKDILTSYSSRSHV